MKEIETLYVSRNDFKAIWECEHCGAKEEAWGYKDYNFDVNVRPNALCQNCGLSALEENAEAQHARLGRNYHLHGKLI